VGLAVYVGELGVEHVIQVVVPAYNCAQWVGRCIESIGQQGLNDAHFDVVVIDDASTDDTQTDIIVNACQDYGFKYRLNERNMGAGYNIYRAIHEDLDCAFDDIVVIVDGDDFLADVDVFERLEEWYTPDTWMLWTQYEPYPHSTGQTPSADYPDDIKRDWAFRSTGNFLNHLITFRSFLFKESIGPKDLQMPDGTWAVAGYDRMICVPMLERCGPDHYAFVDEVTYYYNAVNPISDVYVRLAEAKAAHDVVARLPKKPPLDPKWVAEQRASSAAR
jgi:glycosyltransferase involved in cell wall biosynthesis